MTNFNWYLIDKVVYINIRDDDSDIIYKKFDEINMPKQKVHVLQPEFHLVNDVSIALSNIRAIELAISNHWGNVMFICGDFFSNNFKADKKIIYLFFFIF